MTKTLFLCSFTTLHKLSSFFDPDVVLLLYSHNVNISLAEVSLSNFSIAPSFSGCRSTNAVTMTAITVGGRDMTGEWMRSHDHYVVAKSPLARRVVTNR